MGFRTLKIEFALSQRSWYLLLALSSLGKIHLRTQVQKHFTSAHGMAYVAWDIETCPLPYDGFSKAQQERHDKEVERLRERSPDEDEEVLSQQAGSFHPHLGWICCISAVRGGADDVATPKSWTAKRPEEEGNLLDQFWADVHAIGRHHNKNREELQWVTFNGKSFDVPFLTARTVANGLAPTREDIVQAYPYDHEPHADLMGLWPKSNYSLEGLCSFLGVETPKGDVDGSMVAQLTRGGQIGEVAEYCECDAVATLRCPQEVSVLI